MFFVPAWRDRKVGHWPPKPLFLLKNRSHLCGSFFSAIVFLLLVHWGRAGFNHSFHPTTQ